VASQTPSSDASATQTLDVHNVQSTNPKGNQKSEGMRKYKNKKSKGDNDGEGKMKRGR